MTDQEGMIAGMMMLSKLQAAVGLVMKGLLAALLMHLMDARDLILLAYLMLFLNVLSGWFLMWKDKKEWDSTKWFKTVMKVLWFPVCILATKAVERVYGIDVPIGLLVAGFITVHDLKSLLTNAGELTGLDLWNAIASIDWTRFKRKP